MKVQKFFQHIHKFWLKQLTAIHREVTWVFNDIMKNPTCMSARLTSGTTMLIFKGKDTNDPKNYRR